MNDIQLLLIIIVVIAFILFVMSFQLACAREDIKTCKREIERIKEDLKEWSDAHE